MTHWIKNAGVWKDAPFGSGVNQTMHIKIGGTWHEGRGSVLISQEVKVNGEWRNPFQPTVFKQAVISYPGVPTAVHIAALETRLPQVDMYGYHIDGFDLTFRFSVNTGTVGPATVSNVLPNAAILKSLVTL